MALPLSRNKTYAVGDPVRAADLNDLQDQDIARKAEIVALQAAIAAMRTEHVLGGEGVSNDAGVGHDPYGGKILATTGDEVWYRAPVPVGKTLRAIRVRCTVGASVTITATLHTRDLSPPVSTGFTANTSSSGSQTLTLSAINLLIAAGTTYQLTVSKTGAASCTVGWVEFDWDG